MKCKPNLRYPDALAYQLAKGIIHRFNHGRFNIKGASEGADMVADIERTINRFQSMDLFKSDVEAQLDPTN